MALPASIAASASSMAATCTGIIDFARNTSLSPENDKDIQTLLNVVQILSSALSAMALFWTLNRSVAISEELSDILRTLSISFNHCSITLERVQAGLKEGEREALLSVDIWRKTVQAHADSTALVMDAIVGDPDGTGIDITGVEQAINDMKQAVDEQTGLATLDHTEGLEIKNIVDNLQSLMDKIQQYATVTRSGGGTISISPNEEGPSGSNIGMVLSSASGSIPTGERPASESQAFSRIRELVYNKELTASEEYATQFLTRVALPLESRRLLAEYYYLGGMFGQMIEILKCPREALERDRFLASNVQHLLAKAFFQIGEFNQAIKFCQASLAIRKELMQQNEPVFMESVELLVAILRATERDEEAIATRREYLLEEHRQGFEVIDTLDGLFGRDRSDAAESTIQMLDNEYGRENLMSRVQRMDRFLESVREREFHDVILGFGTDVSLVTIFVDMNVAAWAGLLGIRGMISRGRAPGSRCLAFDNILRKAANQGRTSEVYVLRSFGADVEAAYDSLEWWPQLEEGLQNMSPLCLAAAAGNSDVAALLLGGFASIEAQGYSQMTPLMFATQGGNVTTVQVLLHRGADIEAKDENQKTALFYAAQGGHIDVVELLLDWGADMETVDADGKNPLHYTVPFGHLSIFNLMMRVGAYRQIQMNQ